MSLVSAQFAVKLVEETSEYSVRKALDENELTWAEVYADGLQVVLTGTAPSEAQRFLAISTSGKIVDAARVIDDMQIKALADLAPPRFSIEVLRNENDISLIGLIPAQTDREAFLERVGDLSDSSNIADLLESADYSVPERWEEAVEFGLDALEALPRSKVSIDANRVAVTAMADSETQKKDVEAKLARRAPKGLKVTFDISSPRPVITPFALRFIQDENGSHFDSCSADTEIARARILTAAATAGLEGKSECKIGLGVPTPSWADAASKAIAAVNALKGGSVTFADADITLVAAEGTQQREFDRVIGELEHALPEVFTLHAVLPVVSDLGEGPPEFVATLSPEGLVQMRGRLNDDVLSTTAMSFATARFGSTSVHNSARTDETLPADWPLRVLSSLEALSHLSNGSATATSESIEISGNTGDKEAKEKIAALLSEKLGNKARYTINVTYLKKLDPIAGLPTPEECEAQVAEVLAQNKITFEPGSGTIAAGAQGTLDSIAAILKKCGDLRMEIAGHTDSQGREEMNQNLSKERAQAVLNGLRDRRVLTMGFKAVGHGEAQPIESNDTEEGREANRRIEFKLVRPEPVKEEPTTLESTEQDSAEQGGEAQTEEDAEGAPSEETD
ncbi:OmpA family protein [Lentibacter algarum]|uniref:OmpA family protein n=1 Tax=Lentibacter algarum TaxID=576131 RepID=UPI002090E6F5|nr:OmpA family protein [Lentibacter algarum]